MYGSIVGDFVGSAYEHTDVKGYNLPLVTQLSNFTDDTIMAAATYKSLKEGLDFKETLQEMCASRSDAGFSETMKAFISGEDMEYYESFGNGAAIRVSPIAFFAKSLDEAINIAEKNALVTHKSKEAVKGAQAIVTAIYLTKTGVERDKIADIIKKYFSYNLEYDIEKIAKELQFTTEASVTVPIAIFLALTSHSVESCLRKGLHIGGDTDSIMSMACAILMSEPNMKCPEDVDKAIMMKAKINDPELAQIIEEMKTYQ